MEFLNYLSDPVLLTILFLSLIIGLIIKSRLVIMIVFALAAIGGLNHFLMKGFILENTNLASFLFLAGAFLIAIVLIYNALIKIK